MAAGALFHVDHLDGDEEDLEDYEVVCHAHHGDAHHGDAYYDDTY